ncbi:mitofilin family membrane protein [Fodinicurvata sp. EGI_FJ10296]|uniref:COG4223 family protein n=1 Tax=Fodinicurvata sp. EGI_FJ10296 TaxID=3231908 RepID=UPI003454DC58
MQSTDGDKRDDQNPDATRDGSPSDDGRASAPSSTDRTREGGDAHPASESAAERVIAAFGGIRPMAAKIGVPATTVQGWKKRGVIPEARRDELVKAAADNGITLDDTALGEALIAERTEEPADSGKPDETGRTAGSSAAASGRERVTGENLASERLTGDKTNQPTGQKPGRRTDTAGGNSPWPGSGPGSGPSSGASPAPTAASEGSSDRKTGAAERPDSKATASGPGSSTSGGSSGQPPRPAADSGPRPAPPRDTAVLMVAVVALVIAVIAVAGLVTYPAWAPRYLDTPDPALLAERLDTLESGVDAAMEEPRAAVENFETRISAVESDMTEALERVDAFTGVEIDGRPLADILDDFDSRATTLADEVQQLDDRLAARLPALEERIEAVEGQGSAIESLEGRISGLESERAALGDVRQAIDTLERRINDVDDTMGDVTGRLDSVAGIAEQAAATDATTMALVLAVGQLRDSLFVGAPFEQSLETVREVAAGDGEIESAAETLTPYASSGAPTLSELQTQFPAMADAVREAARTPESGSWTDEALSRVQGLVSVRPVAGEVEGDTPDAILARAEARVMSDNLRGALDALDALDGQAAEAAADWISLARDRIAVEDALATLNNTAVRRLMATRDGG